MAHGKKWVPLTEGVPNPAVAQSATDAGLQVQVFGNDIYQVIAVEYAPSQVHLDIKRHDRKAIINWRHMQQIKNEVCGTQSEGVQLFPAESRLLDEANSYHIYVLLNPPYNPAEQPLMVGTDVHTGQLQVGQPSGSVLTDEQIEEFNRGRVNGEHKGRQEEFDPSMSVGRVEQTPYADTLWDGKWTVTDTRLDGPESVLGRFASHDEAAEFIETQPDFESGRYTLEGPADDE
jgi:hypothetical protein